METKNKSKNSEVSAEKANVESKEVVANVGENSGSTDSLLEAKDAEIKSLKSQLDEKDQEIANQTKIVDSLMEQVSKPVDPAKASVEIDGVTYVVTEENKNVKSIYHGSIPVKIENFTAEMVAEYVEAGLLEEQ